jgi:site-specific DNA-methyltransferase (adenine-specific)
LIESVSNKGDIIIDPASGSYSVLEACSLAKRDFLGCDLKDFEF